MARRWRRAPGERQSGKPAPTGNPAARTARRSGGKENENSASALANSASVRPGWTWILEVCKCEITWWARDEKDTRLFLTLGVVGAEARAERRRRPAACDGRRPVILRSTSTIFYFGKGSESYGKMSKLYELWGFRYV